MMTFWRINNPVDPLLAIWEEAICIYHPIMNSRAIFRHLNMVCSIGLPVEVDFVAFDLHAVRNLCHLPGRSTAEKKCQG